MQCMMSMCVCVSKPATLVPDMCTYMVIGVVHTCTMYIHTVLQTSGLWTGVYAHGNFATVQNCFRKTCHQDLYFKNRPTCLICSTVADASWSYLMPSCHQSTTDTSSYYNVTQLHEDMRTMYILIFPRII